MIETPAILTPDGNIRIHNQEGARIPLFFEDENGNPRDMTEALVAFVTEAGFRRDFAPGIQPHELVLFLEPGDFAAHVDKSVEFIVRDESVLEKPVIWKGIVIVQGW